MNFPKGMDPASDLSFQGSNYLLTKFGALQWRCLRGRMCNKGGTAEDPNRSTRLMRCTKCKTKEMWVSAVAMANKKKEVAHIHGVGGSRHGSGGSRYRSGHSREKPA